MKSTNDSKNIGEGDIPVCKFTMNLNAAFIEKFRSKLENKIMKELPILGNFLTVGEYLGDELVPSFTRQEVKQQMYQDKPVNDQEIDRVYDLYMSKQLDAKTRRREDEVKAKRAAYAIIMGQISEESHTHMAQDSEFRELVARKNHDPLKLWNIFIRTHTSSGSTLPEVRCVDATEALYQIWMSNGETLASYHTRFMAALKRLDEFSTTRHTYLPSEDEEFYEEVVGESVC